MVGGPKIRCQRDHWPVSQQSTSIRFP
jgi:hypothetical protein